jgi:7tm Odorant receptor
VAELKMIENDNSTVFQTNLFEDPENFVKFAMYAGIMVLEIFLPCYFGSRIHDKSFFLRQKVFESQWMDASLEYKKLLVIFLERGKRPVKINLYGFFFLKLETFSSVSALPSFFKKSHTNLTMRYFKVCSFAYRLFTVVKQQK